MSSLACGVGATVHRLASIFRWLVPSIEATSQKSAAFKKERNPIHAFNVRITHTHTQRTHKGHTDTQHTHDAFWGTHISRVAVSLRIQKPRAAVGALTPHLAQAASSA